MHDRLYDRLFAAVYDGVMAAPEQSRLGVHRRRLLEGLQGDVLEPGCGTGANFALYSADARVLAVDPSLAMVRRAKDRLANDQRAGDRHAEGRNPDAIQAEIRVEAAGLGDAEQEARLAECVRAFVGHRMQLDAIVCTLVLCTTPQPERTIDLLCDWLRPGGRFIVLEHVRAQNAVGAALQGAAGPLWTPLAAGCRLNRPTDRWLAEHPQLRPVRETRFFLGMPFYAAELERIDPGG